MGPRRADSIRSPQRARRKSAWTLPSCGREERAHKDLENRTERGFPQRPHASPLHGRGRKKNEAFNRLTHGIPDTPTGDRCGGKFHPRVRASRTSFLSPRCPIPHEQTSVAATTRASCPAVEQGRPTETPRCRSPRSPCRETRRQPRAQRPGRTARLLEDGTIAAPSLLRTHT